MAGALFADPLDQRSVLDFDASALSISEAQGTEDLKQRVARQLLKCPKSAIIIHDVQKLGEGHQHGGGAEGGAEAEAKFGSAAGLIALERFFEDETVEVCRGPFF